MDITRQVCNEYEEVCISCGEITTDRQPCIDCQAIEELMKQEYVDYPFMREDHLSRIICYPDPFVPPSIPMDTNHGEKNEHPTQD